MEEYIRGFSGRIYGIIETDAAGNQTARDFDTRMILGYYRASSNVTTDFMGRIIANGNMVASFIRIGP